MKHKFLKTALLVSFLALGSQARGQVTIGSGIEPNKGALLDLKEDNAATPGGVTAQRGLAMPRVKLNSLTITSGTDLKTTIDNTSGAAWDKDQHIGLWVYNITDAGAICPGLYVWDGTQWQRLQDPCMGIGVSPAGDLLFLSGQNGSTITPQKLTIDWFPTTGTASWSATGINFALPAATSWTTTPMNNVEFSPVAMTAAEVDPAQGGNAFKTKTGELTFTVTDNGKTKDTKIAVNQTNKAITLSTYLHENPTNGTMTNTIKSNAKWKLEKMVPNDGTETFSNIQLNGTALTTTTPPIDWEQANNAGQGNTNNLSYTITTGAAKSRFSTLTFSDAETPKRFNDVTLSIYQCSNVGINPKMSEWAALAGFAGVPEIQTLSDADEVALLKRDTPNSTTGIAWHRDQDGNIFLSSSFDPADITGDGERWMITNLAAKSYATPHSQGRNLVQSYNNAYNAAYWGYPNNVTTYNNNPRLGLLYNWDAATGGKGGSNGQLNINDGENVSVTRPTIQGICPDGWHLPSDVEWTALERIINTNTTTFSSATANANGTITTGTSGWRGSSGANGHGHAMREGCEPGSTKGISNPISTTARPGFETLLAGDAYGGSARGYGDYGYFWSASGNGTSDAWYRYFVAGRPQVSRHNTFRYALFSVRCKKNDH